MEIPEYTARNLSHSENYVVIYFRSHASWSREQIQRNRKSLIGEILHGREVIVVTKGYQMQRLVAGHVQTTTLDYVWEKGVNAFSFPSQREPNVNLHVTVFEEMPPNIAEDIASSEDILANLWLLFPKNYVDEESGQKDIISDMYQVTTPISSILSAPPLVQHEVVAMTADGLAILWFKPNKYLYSARFAKRRCLKHIKMPEVSEETGEAISRASNIFTSGRAGALMQTRFQRISASGLGKETVAGMRDLKLGKYNPGKPFGKKTIRFDTGHGKDPHINIDPKGFSSPKNPHIKLSPGMLKTAQVMNNALKYGGITLTVAAVAIDTWRIGTAIKDDIYINENADEIIKELEGAISELNSVLKYEADPKKRKEILSTIDHLEKFLQDVRRSKKVPVKTIKTVSSVGGGWGGGLAGGWAGAQLGAQAGAAIGTAFGPVGTVVGAPIGAVICAIGGGILAGMGGSFVGEKIADAGLELADD